MISSGLPKALDEFGELNRGLDEAYSRNDAAAAAALFTEDALLVDPDGMSSGRQNIEKRFAGTFQRSPIVSFNCSWDRCYLNAIDNAVWSAGQWFGTFESQTGPVFAVGYWSAIYVREGDDWKIRMWTINQTPPPTPRAPFNIALFDIVSTSLRKARSVARQSSGFGGEAAGSRAGPHISTAG